MEENEKNIQRKKIRSFRETKITSFLDKHNSNITSRFNKNEKIKLCSSDDFRSVAEEVTEKYSDNDAPTIISHVGGFYVTASLAGLSKSISKSNSKPKVLFFDKKTNNVINGLFNTLLIKVCENKEKYISTLFGLDNTDVIKALNPSLYYSFIEKVLELEDDFASLNKKEKKDAIKKVYELKKDDIDLIIEKEFLTDEIISRVIADNFDLNKIVKYASKKPYNSKAHYSELLKLVENKLDNETNNLFKILASDITEYLSNSKNYEDLLNYLPKDIKLNSDYHILANDNIYEGYRTLIDNYGRGSIKFVSGIDIGKEKGVRELQKLLNEVGFIDETDKERSSIDIAFIPHINLLKESYPLLKGNVEDYIMLYKDNKKDKNYFVINNTATLDIRTMASIGAEEIEQERKNRISLTNISKIEEQKGYPLLMFMAGANFGNIYHSENDTKNMIDMALANKVDTVYIQGLIYATYYHNQTTRRMLNDPTYETLDSRLKAAKEIVKKLNNSGIKVVYQMGDEEYHLYEDLFKMYIKEQGILYSDFLKREDLRSKFDWVRPIIIQQLVPYLIRSGEDVVNLYTDEASKTNVSKMCEAIKKYIEGFPLGDLAQYINPEFLKDNDMFKVVYSTIDKFDKNDPAIAVDLISNPNFSTITQYGKPNAGVIKNMRYYQSGAVSKKEAIPQLKVDSRQGFMSVAYQGDEVVMNVPQMINDEYYIKNHKLLSGIKEHILEDPTHKRVTQIQTRPNYPGGYIITGDVREKMSIIPYYKRSREMMEYVQKTGIGMPLVVKGLINDWQMGSPTERPYYDVKFLDYLFHEYNPTGLTINGDIQQGHNYKKFPNESRFLGAMSVTQQMVATKKLIDPYISSGLGVIRSGFECETKDYMIDEDTSYRIIKHLFNAGLIEHKQGQEQNVDRIKRNVDYKTVDLKLPQDLQMYEKTIREKLSNIVNLEYVDIVEGNHEYNTDWDNKGFNEIEIIRQSFEDKKKYTGSDLDLTLTEFLINSKGDIVNAPYAARTINGYNVVNGHCFKPAGKGGGASPTVGIAKWIEQMAGNTNKIDIVNAAHYHIFESSVIDNTLINITGGGAGQSGYEQNLGYSSQPVYVIEKFLPDGSLEIETIGTKFLDEYKVQNSNINGKSINLHDDAKHESTDIDKDIDDFIQECMTEKATIFDRDEPKQMQKLYQRKLVSKGPNKIIGPKIDD